jgi:hypothetical protein
MRILCICLVIVNLAACSFRSSAPATSYSMYGYEALSVARAMVDRLSETYPPTRTTIYLEQQDDGNPGFYLMLDEVLMHAGFTVVREPQAGAVNVRYVVDMIKDSHPLQAYLLLETGKLRFTRTFSPQSFELSGTRTERSVELVSHE